MWLDLLLFPVRGAPAYKAAEGALGALATVSSAQDGGTLAVGVYRQTNEGGRRYA
jgi:hypothetical protein